MMRRRRAGFPVKTDVTATSSLPRASGATTTWLLAPDSFKGSLTAAEVCAALREAILSEEPDARILEVPISDGGDGLVHALLARRSGALRRADVRDPLGRPITAEWALLPGDPGAAPASGTSAPSETGAIAVIEIAAASGLTLLRDKERDPLRTTTLGTGDLLRSAAASGARRFWLGIGGSATNDGGIGMASALGFRFVDADGLDVYPCGGNLLNIDRILPPDQPVLPPGCEVIVACDVDNPLTGSRGAAAVYGPQKGADPAAVARLDAGLTHLARLIERDLGCRVADLPGSGAAGGLGAGAVAFLGGQLRPGADLMLDAVGFNRLVAEADIVFTGEGSIDAQTLHGKAPAIVARRAASAGIPVVAFAGRAGADFTPGDNNSFTAVFPIVRQPCTLDEAIADAHANLVRTARNAVRLWLAARASSDT